MRCKGYLFIFCLLFIFLGSCSNNSKNDVVIINGETSNIIELNNIYGEKKNDECFLVLYVVDNNNGIVTYANITENGFIGQDILYFPQESGERKSSQIYKDYVIKTKSGTISPYSLEKNDVLICYYDEILEISPQLVIVIDVYYLGYKTDKEIKITNIA